MQGVVNKAASRQGKDSNTWFRLSTMGSCSHQTKGVVSTSTTESGLVITSSSQQDRVGKRGLRLQATIGLSQAALKAAMLQQLAGKGVTSHSTRLLRSLSPTARRCKCPTLRQVVGDRQGEQLRRRSLPARRPGRCQDLLLASSLGHNLALNRGLRRAGLAKLPTRDQGTVVAVGCPVPEVRNRPGRVVVSCQGRCQDRCHFLHSPSLVAAEADPSLSACLGAVVCRQACRGAVGILAGRSQEMDRRARFPVALRSLRTPRQERGSPSHFRRLHCPCRKRFLFPQVGKHQVASSL
mgnify:CR=1 FL=1